MPNNPQKRKEPKSVYSPFLLKCQIIDAKMSKEILGIRGIKYVLNIHTLQLSILRVSVSRMMPYIKLA